MIPTYDKEKAVVEYNHNRHILSFAGYIKTIRKYGFNPIGVTQFWCEDTFVFKTPEEATEAYRIIEEGGESISGWWYGEEDFLKEKNEYEIEDKGYKVKVYWLDGRKDED